MVYRVLMEVLMELRRLPSRSRPSSPCRWFSAERACLWASIDDCQVSRTWIHLYTYADSRNMRKRVFFSAREVGLPARYHSGWLFRVQRSVSTQFFRTIVHRSPFNALWFYVYVLNNGHLSRCTIKTKQKQGHTFSAMYVICYRTNGSVENFVIIDDLRDLDKEVLFKKHKNKMQNVWRHFNITTCTEEECGRCGVVRRTLAFGSIGHGFESEQRLFSHLNVSAFSKLRLLS